MSENDKWRSTELVGGGRRKAWRGQLVNVPVTRGSTILFDSSDGLDRSVPDLGDYAYGLQGTPAQWALADALTGLEPGAGGTALFPSGLAAITQVLLALLKAGDELLVVDSVYGPTRRFCDTILSRFGVAIRYYDPIATADEVAAMCTTATAAILLESPGSMSMEVQDVPGICAAARARGIVTVLDNTWATPLLFPALANGVDVSVMALTKFVGGHSDLMLGAATATETLWKTLQRRCWDLGQCVSADDAWLASRGLRTMGVRLQRHEESARKVAAWVKEQPRAGRLLHPAFRDCPGHQHWARDFKGSSSLFAFEFKGSAAERAAFIDRLELFGIGYSWGGFESLVSTADPTRTVSRPPGQNLVRLHIGLEDPEDLIADLEQAFEGGA